MVVPPINSAPSHEPHLHPIIENNYSMRYNLLKRKDCDDFQIDKAQSADSKCAAGCRWEAR